MRLIFPFTLLLLLGRFSGGLHDATGLIFTREVDPPSGHNLDVSKQEINERGTEGEMKEAVPVGNGCPVTAPWPCQQYSFCLSFAFVCDGEIDCPDGYDENPRLCVAKNRPAVALLEGFIRKYRDWLVPKYLGDGETKFIAYNLAISQNIEDYRKNMQLTDEQFHNLERLLDEVVKGRQMGLLMLGMPLQSWSEVYIVLRPIAKGLLNASPLLHP
ncbi:prohormone 4 [Echinococcus multilocularis]|uniref:Prohormone 4 n=1 Tax=Echinococcus multilocularis TaxID=6211 RepID=A0A068Y2M7_ECHMU|nr:prohormone 4 [Echinococcus multilocularis]